MTWVEAVILGLVEGITEYLPVSSTGHLIIAASLLGLDRAPEREEAVDAFSIVIQGGAILAVVWLYWGRFVQMARGVVRGDLAGLRLIGNLVIAFLPAAVMGVLLSERIKAVLFSPAPVAAALAAGGVYMLVVEAWRSRRWSRVRPAMGERGRGLEELTAGQAAFIGLMQCFALVPGTSRSMMTITAGMMARLRPAAAAEFSFLLGCLTLSAACLYELAKDLSRAGQVGPSGAAHRTMFETLGWAPVAIGVLVAGVSAGAAVKWLVGVLNRHGLTPFAWYRLALAVMLAGLVLGGVVRG